MEIGEKIKELRKEKGLTQKKLGELCGMADTTIRQYELGIRNPKIKTLEKIATALDVNVQYLIGWDENKSYESNLSNLPSDLIFDYDNAPVQLSAQQILDVNWNLTFTSAEYSMEELKLIDGFAKMLKSARTEPYKKK